MRKATIVILLVLAISNVLHAQVKPLPALKVSENGRYFQTSDGQPFFWLGDTGWLMFVKLTREQTIEYLDARKAQGFNVIQAMVLHDLKNAVNKYGDSALSGMNVATPITTSGASASDPAQYDFWDHIDFVVNAAAERGMYMALVPVWGTNVKNGWVTREQAHLYAAFLAYRYRDNSNIIWLNGGDIPGSDSMAVWKQLGTTLRQIDTNHLITFHPRGRTTSSRWFHKEEWLDFNMFQSGHRTYAQDTSRKESRYGEDNWRYVIEDITKRPKKPTLDGEPSYEGIPYGLHDTTQPYWNGNEVRRYAYWSVFTGAAGYTYGHNAVMQFYQAGDKGRAFGARKYWQDAMNDSGALCMQHLKKLMLSKPYFDRQGLPPTQSGGNYGRYFGTVGKDGDYSFTYVYTGRPVKIRMSHMRSRMVKASWFNPRTGEYTVIGTATNRGDKEFDPPGDEREGNDWVLVLEAMPPTSTAYLFTSFHEPADAGLRMLYSYDGYHWDSVGTVLLKPEVGKQKVMRDPSIARGPDGTFHLVWTSSWQGDKGFGYASSKDLVNWSRQQFIPVMEHEPKTVNVWAPELFYDDENRQFLIIWASTIPGRFDRGIESDSNNHRMYVTKTTDFRTFTPAELFLDPGFSVIDAVIVKRNPKDYVLVLKDNTRPNRNMKVAFGSRAAGPYRGVSAAFTESFTEGPSVVKVGNEWLIYYDAYRKGTYDAVRTSDFTSFTDISKEVSIPKGHKHGTIFTVDEKILTRLLKQTAKGK